MKLALVVENTNNLEGGSRATSTFSEAGGTIGSAENATWMLRDRRGTVDANHISIRFVDKAFCATSVSSKGVTLNGASRPTKAGAEFRITDGDRWQIGDFEITVFLVLEDEESGPDSANTGGHSSSTWASRFASIETLVPGSLSDKQNSKKPDENLLLSDTYEGEQQREAFTQKDNTRIHEQSDPLIQLDEKKSGVPDNMLDPIALLERGAGQDRAKSDPRRTDNDLDSLLEKDLAKQPRQSPHPDQLPDPEPYKASFVPPNARFTISQPENPGTQPENPSQNFTSMNENTHKEEKADMNNQNELDSYLENLSSGANFQEKPTTNTWPGHLKPSSTGKEEDMVDHVVLRPLLAAMGIPVSDLTGPQADAVAKLAGETIKAAVTGLMKLDSNTKNAEHRLGETHLHPVEDNPLRIEEDPAEALKSLFLLQSPVHLSATAAIEESLNHVNHHEKVSKIAVAAALDSVLQSLSPEQMTSRFERYKGHAPRTGDPDAWHWQMYQHYYREMTSNRQKGLGRMFQEVFRQVYDREMRALVRETGSV